MHTYQKTGHLWTVGFELPAPVDGRRNWRAIKDFDTEKQAAAYASYLNGGDCIMSSWVPA